MLNKEESWAQAHYKKAGENPAATLIVKVGFACFNVPLTPNHRKGIFCCWFMQVLVNTCNLSLHKLYWSYYCQGEMKRDASVPWLEAKTPPGWKHTIPNLHRARDFGIWSYKSVQSVPSAPGVGAGWGHGAVPCLPTAPSAGLSVGTEMGTGRAVPTGDGGHWWPWTTSAHRFFLSHS